MDQCDINIIRIQSKSISITLKRGKQQKAILQIQLFIIIKKNVMKHNKKRESFSLSIFFAPFLCKKNNKQREK